MLTTTAKIAAAATAGYVLGRNKKLRLTILTTCLIAGKDLAEDAKLISTKLVDRNPELEHIAAQLTDELPAAARELAETTTSSGLDAVSTGLDDARKATKHASKAMAK